MFAEKQEKYVVVDFKELDGLWGRDPYLEAQWWPGRGTTGCQGELVLMSKWLSTRFLGLVVWGSYIFQDKIPAGFID